MVVVTELLLPTFGHSFTWLKRAGPLRRSLRPITIASRDSDLARVQAEKVGKALGKLHPEIEVKYLWLNTAGDHSAQPVEGSTEDSPTPLLKPENSKPKDDDQGLKGMFTRSIDAAVLEKKADIAVHSLKDLPNEFSSGIVLAGVGKRGSYRDCLVSKANYSQLEDLPPGSVIGTSSPRRAAQVLCVRPDLIIKPLRGNVPTRLQKVLEGDDYDATILAEAGLKRLKLKQYARHLIPLETMLPAASQGAIAITCRTGDHVALTRCLPLNDPTTNATTNAEREVVAGLGGNCYSAIGVLTEKTDPLIEVKRNADAHWVKLKVCVYAADGSAKLTFEDVSRMRELRRLINKGVKALKAEGAEELLREGRMKSPIYATD